MASRFVEADEEFIEELRTQVGTKTQKGVRATGLTFSNNGKKREEEIQLKSYEVPELNKGLDNFAPYVINK